MKTYCKFSYDLDCIVASLIMKWVKNISNYNMIIEPLSHSKISSYCKKYVNDKEDKYLFIGYDKEELIENNCNPDKLFSLRKLPYKSLSRELYNSFSKDFEFTPPQKHLIALASDKHLFKYSRNESLYIDVYFHINHQKFLYLFNDGFTSFDYMSNNVIKKYLVDCKYEKNDVMDFIFPNSCAIVGSVDKLPYYEYKYMREYDTMAVIDTDIKSVFFRNKNKDNDILNFCKSFCDGGGKNDYCSGKLTDKFMEEIQK